MGKRPINLAILWHMHQPYYKDLVTGEYVLPWVRLHAIKDYYDMVAMLDGFPDVKVNFNLVPSLLIQIEDHLKAEGVKESKFIELTMKEPKDLTGEERAQVLQNFFMANWENMIKPYPRYYDLLCKRGRFASPASIRQTAGKFSVQEMFDLQVWFNIAWFGFIYKSKDPEIMDLIKKGKGFSFADKETVMRKQKEVMAKIIPAYRSAEKRGQIEISVSPFYHPILPLLCDTGSAIEAIPNIALPSVPFRHPEDAAAQINMAVDYYVKTFGKQPQGMWPSEGSVSEQIIPMIASAGFKWIATDEDILKRSTHKIESSNRGLSAEELNQPYIVERDGSKLNIIFRNHFLSDQIGFVYQRWGAKEAADNFLATLKEIHESLPDDGSNYLVSVILDGENAWEYYQGQGKQFLEALYGRLSADQNVRTVKIGEYLSENPPGKKLSRLFAGSWINSDFRIWIGHEEDNTAWDHLNNARSLFVDLDRSSFPEAWQELYIAEGSDWFWWYGDDHSSENDATFDMLFRKHLKNIYLMMKKDPPPQLDFPIKRARPVQLLTEPVDLIQPVLDGKVTNYFEWMAAGRFVVSKMNTAMHRIETILKDIYYGFSNKELFVRIDFRYKPTCDEIASHAYLINILSPVRYCAEISCIKDKKEFAFKLEKTGHESSAKTLSSFAIGSIIELGIPFDEIGVKTGDKVEFAVSVVKDGQEIERWPGEGSIHVAVPTENFGKEQWMV